MSKVPGKRERDEAAEKRVNRVPRENFYSQIECVIEEIWFRRE